MSINREQIDKISLTKVVTGKRLKPVKPGDILSHDFMEPLGLSANALARELHVPPNRISSVLNGSRSITADTALRLARYFGGTAQFWINLQAQYDLELVIRESGSKIQKEISPRAA